MNLVSSPKIKSVQSPLTCALHLEFFPYGIDHTRPISQCSFRVRRAKLPCCDTIKTSINEFGTISQIKFVQSFNLKISPVQEQFQFNRNIGTDYVQQVLEFEQDTERNEEDLEGMEVDDESDVADEVVVDELVHEQVETNIEDMETKSEAIHEAESEVVENDFETKSSFADTNEESETLSSLSTRSIVTVCVAGLFLAVMVVSTVFYTNQVKSNGSKSSNICVHNDNLRRESCCSSTSEGSASFGRFTTFKRVAIKRVSIKQSSL
ncbi:hypothetical protein QVD17_30314 [Tagetes erecta]|uniref:Uncharacterized protein n=1 Tax=Tagetes erecta TaxID=13708 RepID=A0AAD8K2H9_TARER|nr:hypothetical protein QVD17_30314 [Tagetes erecta]